MIKKRSKKAQFYLIAAVIIVSLVIWFASVSNYVVSKKEPEKFYELGRIIQSEGFGVINNLLVSNPTTVKANLERYLDLFANYTNEHLEEDFSLIVVYGDKNASTGNISVNVYSRGDNGGVNFYLGQNIVFSENVYGLKKEQIETFVNGDSSVNVTLIGKNANITQKVPIIDGTNFVFVMTTNVDFNQYVQTNLNAISLL